MQFSEGHIPAFLELFHKNKNAIASAAGCLSLELMRDISEPNTMFTYSTWTDIKSLDDYRKSELFGRIWPQTKRYFAAPAEAWTLQQVN